MCVDVHARLDYSHLLLAARVPRRRPWRRLSHELVSDLDPLLELLVCVVRIQRVARWCRRGVVGIAHMAWGVERVVECAAVSLGACHGAAGATCGRRDVGAAVEDSTHAAVPFIAAWVTQIAAGIGVELEGSAPDGAEGDEDEDRGEDAELGFGEVARRAIL